MSGRFMVSLCAGLIAAMVALNCDIPLWRNWPIGDATDFGVTTFLLFWSAIGIARMTAHNPQEDQ